MSVDQGNTTEMDDLQELDWVPVPNVCYLMKYVFCDAGYNILLSNLTSLYGEKMSELDVQARFTALNPFAQMKSRVILENLKKSLQKHITDQSDLVLKLNENRVIITLSFSAAHAKCKYDIEMSIMPEEKVMKYIICPTVLGALLSQRKVLELQQQRMSAESTKSFKSNKAVSSQNSIDPDWLKGENVPAKFLCDSFLTIQSHFKDLYAENCEAYASAKNIKAENTSTVHSVSPHKKVKLLENIKNESNITFEDDDDFNLIKKEKEMESSVSSVEPSRTVVRKKKVIKF